MKKYLKILFSFIALSIFTNNVYATTIKETTATNDEYDTIERNTTIIGVTKFTANEVITAGKATTAGANDATLYMKKHGTTEGYTSPTIYIYYGPVGGWYSLDENNNATYINDKNLLEKLSKLEIYYVNNKEKVIGVEYTGDEIDTRKLPKGVSYSNNQLLVNSTLSSFEITTKNQNNLKFYFDEILNIYETNDHYECYSIEDGYITNYDDKCKKEIIIPTKINNKKITGIKENAFNNKGIKSVVIPETIIHLEKEAFANNPLESVIINEKYNENDFVTYGEKVFGNFENIIYNDKLSRGEKIIPETIKINVSQKLICQKSEYSIYNCNVDYDYIYEYIVDNIRKKLEDNGYDDFRLYPEGIGDKIKIVLGIGSNIVKKEIKLEINYFESTNKEEQTIKEIINKLETEHDQFYENYLNLYQLEILSKEYGYDIKYYNGYDGTGYGGGTTNFLTDFDSSNKEPTIGLHNLDDYLINTSTIIIEKDNKIYGTLLGKYVIGGIDLYGLTHEYIIYPNFPYKGYKNIDLYISDLLKFVKEKTQIKNYEILNDYNEKYYIDYNYMGLTNIDSYNIDILDLDTNLIWKVIFTDYYEDEYDENGYTALNCFTIKKDTIVDYDDRCGENVIIPNKNIYGEYITKIDKEAFATKMIRSVKLPEKLTEISESAFYSTSLEKVEFSQSIEKIGLSAFYANRFLTKVELPKKLKIIEANSFANTNLKKINIPNDVEIIKTSAFYGAKLEEVTLPNSIKYIGAYAFYNNKIKEVIVPKNIEEIGENAFDKSIRITYEDKFFELMHQFPKQIDINIHENIYNEIITNDYGYYYITEEGYKYTKTLMYNLVESIIGNNYDGYIEDYICKNDFCILVSDEQLSVYNRQNKKFDLQIKFKFHKITGKEEELQKSKEIINNKIKDIYVEKYIERDQGITSHFTIGNILQKDGFSLVKVYDDISGEICPLRGDIEEVSFCGGKNMNFYLMKDEVLYAITDEYLKLVTPLYYVSNLNPDNYNTINEYKQGVLNAFSKYTEVTNYEIETLEEEVKEKLFIPENQDIIYVKDNDTNRYWYILYKNMELVSKQVPINLIPKGKVQTGKAIDSITSDVLKVTLYGTKKVIEKLDYLSVEINVDGLSTNKEFDVKLVAPKGIETISANNAKISVTLGEEITKEIENIMIEVQNLDSNYKAAAIGYASTKVNAIIKGTKNVLDTIDYAQIRAVIDLTDYKEEGDYDAEIIIIGEDLKATYTSSSKTVRIRISKR